MALSHRKSNVVPICVDGQREPEQATVKALEQDTRCTECLSSFLQLVSAPQVKGFVFLALTLGAEALKPALDSQALIDHNLPHVTQDETRSKGYLLTETCNVKTAKPLNKSAKVTYGLMKGPGANQKPVLVPNACIMQKQEACLNEFAEEKAFLADVNSLNARRNILNKARSKGEQKFNNWTKDINKKVSKLGLALSQEQTLIWNEMLKNLTDLMSYYFKAQTVNENDLGNCGEYASHSLIKLLQKKMEYGFDLKIQVVIVEAINSPNRIKDHIYLLLDSNIGDCVTKTAAQTEAMLKEIRKGKVCDVWNNGFFNDFKSVESSFYANGWETMEIKTIDLSFSKLEKLPEKLQKLYCTMLSSIGLTVQPASKCEFGLTEKTTHRKDSPNDASSVSQEQNKLM